MTIERIEYNKKLLALIVREGYCKEGTNFISEKKHSFQVGFHNVKRGKRYKAHVSLPFKDIKILKSNKIYYIKKGKVEIDFYNNKNRVSASILNKGDLIIFILEGHGVTVLKDTLMIEIKQGSYRGVKKDKRFLE